MQDTESDLLDSFADGMIAPYALGLSLASELGPPNGADMVRAFVEAGLTGSRFWTFYTQIYLKDVKRLQASYNSGENRHLMEMWIAENPA